MINYPGVNPVAPWAGFSFAAGLGIWPTPKEAQGGDARSAANLMTAVESLTDRVNLLGWRIEGWNIVDGSTSNYSTAMTLGNPLTWTGLHTFKAGITLDTGGALLVEVPTVMDGTVFMTDDVSFTGQVITKIKMAETQPVVNADVGPNVFHSTNIVKAWGSFSTDGAGNISIDGGLNIASVNISGGSHLLAFVAFARAMSNADYAVAVNVVGTVGLHAQVNLRSVGSMSIGFYTALGGIANVDLSTTTVTFTISVHARQ